MHTPSFMTSSDLAAAPHLRGRPVELGLSNPRCAPCNYQCVQETRVSLFPYRWMLWPSVQCKTDLFNKSCVCHTVIRFFVLQPNNLKDILIKWQWSTEVTCFLNRNCWSSFYVSGVKVWTSYVFGLWSFICSIWMSTLPSYSWFTKSF